MRTQGERTGQRKRGGLGLDVLFVALLFVGAVGVRWQYAKAVVFSPLDDPAFYLLTAENLAAGHGLEVDVLWSYYAPRTGVTHPSHEHWMPLPTFLMAGAFYANGLLTGTLDTSLLLGQLPGLVLGALLAPLTYVVGRRILPGRNNRWMALGAALLIAVNATLAYQSASADSSAPYAFLAAWALATAVRPPGDEAGYFGTGLLITLAYLTRADGLLLLVAVPLAWWLLPEPTSPRLRLPERTTTEALLTRYAREDDSDEEWAGEIGPEAINVLELVIIFAIAVAPWLVRNYLAFGTPLPGSVLNQAWLTDYVDTFNYLSPPALERWLAQGWDVLLQQRLDALLHNGQVFLLNTFPWGLLALPGLWLLRQRRAFYPALVYGILLFFVTAFIFPVSAMSGTFYHSLGAVLPALALAAAYAVQRAAQRLGSNRRLSRTLFGAVSAGLLVLAGAQIFLSLPAVAERHEAEQAQFETVAAWLTQHADPGDVVMTTQPYTLNYASGHPAIVLPGNEPPDAAWAAAQHYGARYLVITQTFGRYPQVLHEQPDPRFQRLETTEGAEIYAIAEGQP